MTKYFRTNKNYLKKSPLSGSTTLAAPTTATAWFTFRSTHTIDHNLGYVPLVRVYYEPYADGRLFPATGSTIYQPPHTNSMSCIPEVSTTQLKIHLETFSSSSGNIPIYWIIYLDTPQ